MPQFISNTDISKIFMALAWKSEGRQEHFLPPLSVVLDIPTALGSKINKKCNSCKYYHSFLKSCLLEKNIIH
jgi:hypothetical protein